MNRYGFPPSRWIDGSSSRLIGHAARTAPEECSERLCEEWLAHSQDLAASTARLRFALGCYWAVMVISRQRLGFTRVSSNAPTGETIMTAYAHRAIPLFSRETNTNAATGIVCEINTTPLIDIMLVLLITLIIVLPAVTHAVRISLPQGSPVTVTIPPPVIDLDIDFDGTVVWNGTAIQRAGQLEDDFRAEAAKNPQPEIRLRPSPRVRYDFVAKVLALAQRSQLKKVGFINTGEFQE